MANQPARLIRLFATLFPEIGVMPGSPPNANYVEVETGKTVNHTAYHLRYRVRRRLEKSRNYSIFTARKAVFGQFA